MTHGHWRLLSHTLNHKPSYEYGNTCIIKQIKSRMSVKYFMNKIERNVGYKDEDNSMTNLKQQQPTTNRVCYQLLYFMKLTLLRQRYF